MPRGTARTFSKTRGPNPDRVLKHVPQNSRDLFCKRPNTFRMQIANLPDVEFSPLPQLSIKPGDPKTGLLWLPCAALRFQSAQSTEARVVTRQGAVALIFTHISFRGISPLRLQPCRIHREESCDSTRYGFYSKAWGRRIAAHPR